MVNGGVELGSDASRATPSHDLELLASPTSEHRFEPSVYSNLTQ